MKNESPLEIIFDLLNKYDEEGKNYESFEKIRDKDILFPTELFNERWLMKIFLFLAKEKKFKNVSYIPNPDKYGSLRYVSEVAIGALTEQGNTKADGLIGTFEFLKKSKVTLNNNNGKQCLYFYEAKMYSPLSSKTTNTGDNQIERYLKNAQNIGNNKHIDKKFILIYPKDVKIKFNQNGSEEIREWVNCKEELLKMTTETIKKKYDIDDIDILFISWEEIKSDINDSNYNEQFTKFYDICLKTNKIKAVKWPLNF